MFLIFMLTAYYVRLRINFNLIKNEFVFYFKKRGRRAELNYAIMNILFLNFHDNL